MVLRRLLGRLRQHTWLAVLVDLAVVVIGILVALEVDGWAQAREDRRLERVYLQRLEEDLEIERANMAAARRYAEDRIAAARLLGRLAAKPALALDEPSRVPSAIETASWRSFPQINASVYRELQSTGRIVLIRSEALRRDLAGHYTALQHDARVGEDLAAQQRFDAAVAGLLAIDELEAVERAEGDHALLQVPPERALALARSFAGRPAAVAELASLVQHHTFNLRVISQMQSRADALIRQIDELLHGVQR